jgi:hypothetical protein
VKTQKKEALKIHALIPGSGLITGLFSECGLTDPKEWNAVVDEPRYWRGVTCKNCLKRRCQSRNKPRSRA